ncbi:hypothetical protein HMPREF1548_05471 [Clostridium sp. KLE 1755]|nr:hypothetical protein HMPREF1548_05471 [Clostridium sp. KLE 1755]
MQSADLGRRYTVGIFTGNCESIGQLPTDTAAVHNQTFARVMKS